MLKRRGRSITVRRPRPAQQVADQELRAEGRRRIAAAALPLFLRYGYHATPVRMIADAAGISSGSIFNYFAGKDELLDESQAEAERSIQAAQQTLAASREADDPVDRFLRVFRAYAHSLDRIHRFVLLAYQEAKSLAPERRTRLFDREHRIAEVLKTAAAPAIQNGRFAATALDLRVHALIALAQAWSVRHWAFAHYATIDDYLNDLEPIAVGIMASSETPGRRLRA